MCPHKLEEKAVTIGSLSSTSFFSCLEIKRLRDQRHVAAKEYYYISHVVI